MALPMEISVAIAVFFYGGGDGIGRSRAEAVGSRSPAASAKSRKEVKSFFVGARGGGGRYHVRDVLLLASIVCGIAGVALFVASAFVDQGFFCDIKPLIATQLVDHHPDHDHDHQNEKSSSPHDRTKLEINFTLFVYNKYCVNLSEEDETQSIAICQYEEPAITATHTIDDVRSLDTELDVVKLFLSEQLYQLKIKDDEWHDSVVEDIIKRGREIGKSDSKIGPKILRLRVDMSITHILELCDICSDKTVLERDALLKKMLKRTRVVANDEQHDENEEEEEAGRERKRLRFVRENELCPICMEEFIAGWDEAPLSQEQIDKEFAAQLSLLDSKREGKDIVNEGDYSEEDFDMLLAMAISIEERNSSKPSSSTGSTHQNQIVSDTGDDESDDVVPAVAEGAAGSSSNRSV
ncbi:hypothetical protein L3X38_043509 [Prunus dulcis]|uniref:Uncharacterized protein n=1 Tax=Prunus dulcis TaxID=3755 RepID=A0AAD4YN10_PRUDU|nr:hypothetical protein L3X38_043509 [Prunus dulcis]